MSFPERKDWCLVAEFKERTLNSPGLSAGGTFSSALAVPPNLVKEHVITLHLFLELSLYLEFSILPNAKQTMFR